MKHFVAIGDIHGCLPALKSLLEKISFNPQGDFLVFLGDYIDRGPFSKEVLDILIELKVQYPRKVICLLGNHEWMLLQYLKGKGREIYLLNGGDKTLAQFIKDGIVNIPQRYISFLESLLPYWEKDDYIFVHAGLRPYIPLEEQDIEDLLFIREEFIYSTYDWGKCIIFGHTPQARPLILSNKIGIDTGCVYGGRLTAVRLPEKTFYSVDCGRWRNGSL